MDTRNFRDLLANREEQGLKVCVGLDPTHERITKFAHRDRIRRDDIFDFNRLIIEAIHDLMLACKLDLGCYAGMGTEGFLALEDTAALIRMAAPKVPVILDGKFGGAIGLSNDGWAKYAFEDVGADAVTVQGFPGADALEPFLKRADKGIFVLCHTSNPGAGEFQALLTERQGTPLFLRIAEHVAESWNTNGNCGLVVNAARPTPNYLDISELAQVREIAPEIPILSPGVGAQGGDIERTVRDGMNSKGGGIIVSASRSLIFARNPRMAAQKLHDQIQAALTEKKEA